MSAEAIKAVAWNGLLLAGVLVFSFGCWMAWRPLGFMVAGLALAVVGYGGGVEQMRVKAGSRR